MPWFGSRVAVLRSNPARVPEATTSTPQIEATPTDSRDLSVKDDRAFIIALAQSKTSPGQHFHIFCVDDESCAIAKAWRNRLYYGRWKDLPAVDPIASDGISILTYTENNHIPPQVSDLTRAFAATSIIPNWLNGSGRKGTTIGSTGPSDDQLQTTSKQKPPPPLLKGPQDFAPIIGPLK